MASHAETFVRIQAMPIVENQGFISCDSNSDATIAALADTRGEHSTKIQGWEILIIGFEGNSPLVRLRNPLGVFLGVDTIANNSVVKAQSGLDDRSKWKLEYGTTANAFKIAIIANGTTYYMNVVGSAIKIADTSTVENPSLWYISVHNELP